MAVFVQNRYRTEPVCVCVCVYLCVFILVPVEHLLAFCRLKAPIRQESFPRKWNPRQCCGEPVVEGGERWPRLSIHCLLLSVVGRRELIYVFTVIVGYSELSVWLKQNSVRFTVKIRAADKASMTSSGRRRWAFLVYVCVQVLVCVCVCRMLFECISASDGELIHSVRYMLFVGSFHSENASWMAVGDTLYPPSVKQSFTNSREAS